MHERDVIERIFKRIKEHPSGCWIVDGWSDGKGYRNISINGKTCKVHRVMFEWFWRRKLRKGVQVDHKCCNRSCCNPLHLQSCMNKKNSKLRDKRKSKMGQDEIEEDGFHFVRDGDMWCCRFDDFIDLVVSPAGFGQTKREAYEDLKENMLK